MSCSQVRRELLEHFRFPEELGSRSGPHLAHLESCAACRKEVGIDLVLVNQLRRALRERVNESAPSPSSWEVVRRRTVDSENRPWTDRFLHWGGMIPAAATGILMFAVATASYTGVIHESRSPAPAGTSSEQAGRAEGEASSLEAAWMNKYRTFDAVVAPSPLLYGQRLEIAREMPPIPGRMQ